MRKCGCHSHNGLLLSPEGLAPRKDSFPLGVDMGPSPLYLDKVDSVSALIEFEFNDEILEDQYRRFLNGS